VVDAGLQDAVLWVVRRATLAITRFPQLGERITVTTACSALASRWAERRTTLPGVEAVALWVAIDPRTLRPARIESLMELYAQSAGDRKPRTGLTHPAPPAGAQAAPWTFRAADLDVAGHVNNAAYWQVLAGETPPAPLTVEVEHRAAATLEPAVLYNHGEHRWVTKADGTVCASFALA